MLDDEWTVGDDGAYDLWVLGPNGFHRYFKGDLSKVQAKNAPNPEIFVGYNVFEGGLHLQLRNEGNSHLSFDIKSNKIYGPLLAVGAAVSAATVPQAPGFGPLPGFNPVGSGPVPGLPGLPVFGQPGFGFPPGIFFPGAIFGHGPSTSWDVKVPASGRPAEVYFNLRTSAQWYDFVITSDSDSSFYRRVAGHVETGRDSVTDPGMALADNF